MMMLSKTQKLVMNAAFTAIIIIMAFVPFLGYIPFGFMNATIIHIPVIIGAILLGPKSGAWLGFVFGCTSLWKNSTAPNPTSFVFSPLIPIPGMESRGMLSLLGSLIISLLPRILIGIIAYYGYHWVMKALKKEKRKQSIAMMVAGVAGSLTNTFLVMNLIYLFFGSSYAEASGKVLKGFYSVILGVIFINGIPEAMIAGILTFMVTKALLKAINR
ncbi:MAG: ECF transporter S component [Hungatella sp.]